MLMVNKNGTVPKGGCTSMVRGIRVALTTGPSRDGSEGKSRPGNSSAWAWYAVVLRLVVRTRSNRPWIWKWANEDNGTERLV